MITAKTLDIFKTFKGSIDGWIRTGTAEQKQEMTDADWQLLDSFIQDYGLVKRELAALPFQEELIRKMQNSCDVAETFEKLIALVKKSA